MGVPSREELVRFFFLDDVDRALIDRWREDHARSGFTVQLTTVRAVVAFLADPGDVPSVVVDYLAGQLGVADPSCLVAYLARRTTRFEHRTLRTSLHNQHYVDYGPMAAVGERRRSTGGSEVWSALGFPDSGA